MNLLSTLPFIVGISAGLGIGLAMKDTKIHRLYLIQTERGDYWFDKYMMLAKPGWTPLCEKVRREIEQEEIGCQK